MARRGGARFARDVVLCAAMLGGGSLAGGAGRAADTWVQAWEAPPAFPEGPELTDQTVRETIRVAVSGDRIVLRIGNELGRARLVFGSVHVARPGARAGSIDPGSDRLVTFGGRTGLSLEPGMPAVSDPVAMEVTAGETLSVSLFVRRNTGPAPGHPLGLGATFVSGEGDHCADAVFARSHVETQLFFLTGVIVSRAPLPVVVAMGDSITDGYGSTPGMNARWPDRLNQRARAAGRPLSVVNAGLTGNRLLHDEPEEQFGPSGLARFDRDVLAIPGVTSVIILESINDIGQARQAGLFEQAVTAEDIIAGFRQLALRAHQKGLKVFLATLPPFEGTRYAGYYDAEAEGKRQAVNAWIRKGEVADGVFDFDSALRDTKDPKRLDPRYDSGDHLHPNDAGYRTMAEIIPLDVF